MARVRPNRVQVIEVNDWLRRQRDEVERTPVSAGELARRASEELGYAIPESLIRTLAEPANIPLKRRERKGNKDRVVVLGKHLVQIYDELGVPVPQDLLEVARIRRS
jgi:hypothetical protein